MCMFPRLFPWLTITGRRSPGGYFGSIAVMYPGSEGLVCLKKEKIYNFLQFHGNLCYHPIAEQNRLQELKI